MDNLREYTLQKLCQKCREVDFRKVDYNPQLKAIYSIDIYTNSEVDGGGELEGNLYLLVNEEKTLTDIFVKVCGHHSRHAFKLIGDLNDYRGALRLHRNKKEIAQIRLSKAYDKSDQDIVEVNAEAFANNAVFLKMEGMLNLGRGVIPPSLTTSHRFKLKERFENLSANTKVLTLLLLFWNFYMLSDLKNQIPMPMEFSLANFEPFQHLLTLSKYDKVTIRKYGSTKVSGNQEYFIMSSTGNQLLAVIELFSGPRTDSSDFIVVRDAKNKYIFHVTGICSTNCKIWCENTVISENRLCRQGGTEIISTELDMSKNSVLPYLKFYQNQIRTLLCSIKQCENYEEEFSIKFRENHVNVEPVEFAVVLSISMFFCAEEVMKKANLYLKTICPLKGKQHDTDECILTQHASILQGVGSREIQQLEKLARQYLSTNFDTTVNQHSTMSIPPSAGYDFAT